MIQRDISDIAKTLFKMYPIQAITGIRQSGKKTLVKNIFPSLDYVTKANNQIKKPIMENLSVGQI